MKIALIGDIHNGITRASSVHPETVRQANSQALSTLREVLPKIMAHRPDLVVQLGDVIRDEYDKETDTRHYHEVLTEFDRIAGPIIHLLGNHDLLPLDRTEISTIYAKHKQQAEFSGKLDIAEWQIVWLGLEINENKEALLPAADFEMLKTLDPNKSTLIFSHYSLVNWDERDHFYTPENKRWMTYLGADQIMAILAGKNIIAGLSGHAHWAAYQKADKCHFIACPSFTDNIAAEKFGENNPGVFSLLDVADHKLTFKSFSGKFAFLDLELEY